MNTTRRYSRSLSEAFPDERSYCVETPEGVRMSFPINRRVGKVREFIDIYRLYRRASHSRWYCLRMAWGIVVIGRDF